MRPVTELADAIGGFVAAEGCFVSSSERGLPSFAFAVALGARDASACHLLHAYFGCGTVHAYPRRSPGFDDEVRFQVRRFADLRNVIVPFMDEHLPPSRKRDQFDAWREALLADAPRRSAPPRSCLVDGCTRPHRAKGLCNTHYQAWVRAGRPSGEAGWRG
jgi:hypothetical protein